MRRSVWSDRALVEDRPGRGQAFQARTPRVGPATRGRLPRYMPGITTSILAAWAALLASAAGCEAPRAVEVPPPPPGTSAYDVFFIGNSLTYQNDLPGTLAGIAASAGDIIRVRSVAAPNLALIDHLNGQTNALAVIGRGGWEYVVLQQGPSTLPVNRDTLTLATRLFAPSIRAIGGRPALFMVWPDRSRLEYFDEVRISYQQAAQAVGGLFLPAGQAWRRAWIADPGLALYGSDGFHPSPLGTFLAALVMYERITGHDAQNLPPTATVSGRPLNLPGSTVRLLQRAAHEANAQFP
ncbi:MAG: hypothetical protein ACREMO_09040 [Gemmatimonadales bacterium]